MTALFICGLDCEASHTEFLQHGILVFLIRFFHSQFLRCLNIYFLVKQKTSPTQQLYSLFFFFNTKTIILVKKTMKPHITAIFYLFYMYFCIFFTEFTNREISFSLLARIKLEHSADII